MGKLRGGSRQATPNPGPRVRGSRGETQRGWGRLRLKCVVERAEAELLEKDLAVKSAVG